MFTQKKQLSAMAIACALFVTSGLPKMAQAAQSSGVNSSAGVLASCSIIGSTIAFGNYNSTQVDQTGNIAVLCSNGVSYTIALDAGAGAGATTSQRKLTGSLGGSALNYLLYRDAARTAVWGTVIGSDTQASTGNGLVQNLTVYGRIASAQTPLAGVYTDTVTVTLTY